MVRELNMDTQRQNFWKESIHKEAAVRLAWHMRFSKDFSEESKYIKSPPPKKEKTFFPKIPTVEQRKTKSKGFQLQPIKLITDNCDENTLLIEMRPVSSKTRNLLYKGFSALGEGRYAYLQARKERKPEQKYEFPITSGWEYGWKITDAMKSSSTKPAEFGRTRIVKDSFYRNNGVAPHDEVLSCFQ